MHKPNNVTLDGNFGLYSQDQLRLSLYANVKLEQDEKKRELPSKLHLRAQHEDNKIFSVGVEGFDPVFGKCPAPQVVSAWGLYGLPLTNGYKAFGGAFLGLHLGSRSLQFQRFLLGVKHNNLTGHLEFAVNRVVDKDGAASNERSAIVRFDSTATNELKVGGDVSYNFNSKAVDAKLYGEYAIDSATFVKAKVQNDNSLTVGLTHNYKQLINFGFISKVNFYILLN